MSAKVRPPDSPNSAYLMLIKPIPDTNTEISSEYDDYRQRHGLHARGSGRVMALVCGDCGLHIYIYAAVIVASSAAIGIPVSDATAVALYRSDLMN
jgi:hypothetical protein